MSDTSGRIEPYLARLYRFAFSLAGTDDEARDLVQSCALKALSARQAPVDEPAFRAWLFRILRNEFIDRYRRARRTAEHFDDMPPEEDAGEYWGGDERLINVVGVRAGFARLPQPHREILALIDCAGLSYEEAALALAVPVGTVMSRLSRARRRLLAEIEGTNVVALKSRGRAS